MTTTTSRWLWAAASALLLVTGCSSKEESAPLPPAAPTGLTATAGDGQATLSWNAVAGATGYVAYHAAAPGVLKTTGARVAGIAAPPHTITGLANGTTSYFVVTAVGAGGESAESNEVSATPTAPPAFVQADLAGDWDVLRFSTNSVPGWMHAHARMDAAGQVTVLEVLDDTGGTDLPPPGFDLRATIAADGTVQLVGADGNPTFHGTMTATKALVFATDDEGAPTVQRRNLWAWRKRVPGVTYSSADIAGFPFTVHGIYSGPGAIWMYGTGVTDASGVLTLNEIHDSQGGSGGPVEAGTLAIDPTTGVVVNVGGVLRGVMAPDKDAIFFVDTTGGEPSPGFLVVQRTGATFALADLGGSRVLHLVASGADAATSGWQRGANTIDASGLLTFTSFLDSGGSTAAPGPVQLALSPAGVVTMPGDANLHGQLAHGKDFFVITTTAGGGVPMLGIDAR